MVLFGTGYTDLDVACTYNLRPAQLSVSKGGMCVSSDLNGMENHHDCMTSQSSQKLIITIHFTSFYHSSSQLCRQASRGASATGEPNTLVLDAEKVGHYDRALVLCFQQCRGNLWVVLFGK